MKKKVTKTKWLGTEKQRLEMLMEEVNSSVQVIAEQSTIHSKKLEKLDIMQEDLQTLKDDMAVVKTIVNQHSKTLNQHSETLKQHSEILGEHSVTLKQHSEALESIKQDTTSIKNDLKEKVDRKEFASLEHRVLFLEQKLRHA